MKHNLKAVRAIKDVDIEMLMYDVDNPAVHQALAVLKKLQDDFYDPEPLDPLDDGISMVKLLMFAGEDKSVVNAARVSFGGDNDEELDDRDVKLINYLMKEHHGSPTEHNLMTFKVIAPIFVDRQWVRHRVGVSKNEISGRYVEMKERYYTPRSFRMQAKSNRQASVEADDRLDQEVAIKIWHEAWAHAYNAYQQLLELGVTREQARGVLPLTLYTENYYSFNLRSLMHFIALRDHEGAQWEMRLFARALYQLALPLYPETLAAFERLRTH